MIISVAEAPLLLSLEPQLSQLQTHEWPDTFQKGIKKVQSKWDVRELLIPGLKQKLAPLAEVPGVALPPFVMLKKAKAPRRPMWLQILVGIMCMFWLCGVLGTQRGPIDIQASNASMAQLAVPSKFRSEQLQLRGSTRRGVGSPDVDRVH